MNNIGIYIMLVAIKLKIVLRKMIMKLTKKIAVKEVVVALGVGALVFGSATVNASPEEDLNAFKAYYKQKFPDTPMNDFNNGVYSIDAGSREQWESIEEFPPYEVFVELGEDEWGREFANGKSYASCFGEDVAAIRPRYPHWDVNSAKVITLEGDINKCLKSNGEKPLKWKKGKIAHLAAYISYQARGQKINVIIPDDPKAQEAYEDGKRFFYAKRGQLNLACADCHVYQSGQHIRADLLSPALGHTTGFPVFRAKWSGKSKDGDGFGTLHRRYGGCNKQVRAKPFKAQSDEYRNLEFFHAYMSNGQEINGPAYRK
jgi:sulfur-oxidizing protein SoxA